MKETKYYTPTIEEFHVGFECEYLSYRGHSDPTWIDYTIGKLKMQDAFDKVLELDLFRVKYLDKEDVESLGFFKADYGPWWNNENGFQMVWNALIGNGVQITKTDRSNENGYRYVFSGYIKNKSELKRIMNQLKIEE